MTTTVWEKDCACPRAEARQPDFTLRHEYIPTRDVIRVLLTFHPGPVCQRCGTPWRHIPPQEDT